MLVWNNNSNILETSKVSCHETKHISNKLLSLIFPTVSSVTIIKKKVIML